MIKHDYAAAQPRHVESRREAKWRCCLEKALGPTGALEGLLWREWESRVPLVSWWFGELGMQGQGLEVWPLSYLHLRSRLERYLETRYVFCWPNTGVKEPLQLLHASENSCREVSSVQASPCWDDE